MKCPNCDEILENDFCYNCGYATSYNYYANKSFIDNATKKQKSYLTALNSIKKAYKTVTVDKDNKVILPIQYIDADRAKIRKFFIKINEKYNTSFSFSVENPWRF